MHFIGHYVGIPIQMEILLWSLLGICYTTFDTSLFRLKDDLLQVWSLNLDSTYFTDNVQIFMKYLISGIVLIRTLSLHIYLAMYIVMLWPIIFEDRPGLILPWLTIGAIRNIVTVFLSFLAGNYICLKYLFTKLICYEYLLSQLIEHGPSIYVWICVLSYYKQLRKRQNTSRDKDINEIVRRRRRTRTLMRKLCSNDTDTDRQLVSISTIENVVNQLTSTLHRLNTRSLDSLLTNLAAEADQQELLNMEHIKNIREENELNIQEKTRKLLNLSESEVEAARTSKMMKTSSLSLMEIAKYAKFKENSLKTYMNVFDQKSERSINTRMQSDSTVFRCGKSEKLHGKCSGGSSETEIRTITMSDDGNNSTFFTCVCDMDNVESSTENLVLSYNNTNSTPSDGRNINESVSRRNKIERHSSIEENTSVDDKNRTDVETIRTFLKEESTITFDDKFDNSATIDDKLINAKTSIEEEQSNDNSVLLNNLIDNQRKELDETINAIKSQEENLTNRSYTSLNLIYDSGSDMDLDNITSIEDATKQILPPIKINNLNHDQKEMLISINGQPEITTPTSSIDYNGVQSKNNLNPHKSRHIKKKSKIENNENLTEDLIVSDVADALHLLFKGNTKVEDVRTGEVGKRVDGTLDDTDPHNTCEIVEQTVNANLKLLEYPQTNKSKIDLKENVENAKEMKDGNFMSYPKGEKCHQDGFMLDYLNKLKNKKSRPNDDNKDKHIFMYH